MTNKLLDPKLILRHFQVSDGRLDGCPTCTGLLNGIIVILMMAPMLAGQATDVVANFNSTNNLAANSAFSYGSGNSPAAFTPLPHDVHNCFGTPMDCRDTGLAPPNDGIIFWNGTSSNIPSGISPNTALRMDPQSAGAIVRFTAPAAGAYFISGSYQGIDPQQRPVNALVYVNGSLSFSSVISSYGQMAPFNLNVSVGAGQTIDFIVTEVNIYAHLSVGLAAVIAPKSYLNPRYNIMGVTYAPPGGTASSVSYQTTNAVGNTSTITKSFTDNIGVSVGVSEGVSLLGAAKGKATETVSGSWTQKTTTSNAVTISKTNATILKTAGVPNVYSPVNHDYDIIWLWLNPVVFFAPLPNGSVAWNGYGYDLSDPLQDLDVWGVYVGYLNGDFGQLDAQDADALARSWVKTQTFEPGQGPGITSADYANILKADPFAYNPYAANSGYTLTLTPGTNPATSTDGRFTMATPANGTPQSITYAQAAPNSVQAPQTTYQSAISTINQVTQTSDNTYSVGFGVESSFGGTLGASFVGDLKVNWNLTWENISQTQNTTTNTQTDTAVIAGPPCPATTTPCNPEYTEPHEFAVYQDNLYGTFMFWPNPYFSIQALTPTTATVGAGSAVTFTISTLANAGYSGTAINFDVKGLPAGASFVRGTVVPGSSFPLVVSTTSATQYGTYPLTISASDGSQSYLAYATLVVDPVSANQLSFPTGAFTLLEGGSIRVGAFNLIMQGDGNLVFYGQGGAAIWSTGTYGQNCSANKCFAVFQADGNLVVYNGSTVLWSSKTSGNAGAQLFFSTQAPYVAVVGSNQAILWAAQRVFAAGQFTLAQGESINFSSFTLAMQGDGNLVLYSEDGSAVWSTGTFGQNCGVNQCSTVFQSDGNLVVYNASTPLWNSQTYGNRAAQLTLGGKSPQLEITSNNAILWTDVPRFDAGNFTLNQGGTIQFGSMTLIMQSDGNLVLYDVDSAPIWDTGTYGQDCGSAQCHTVFQPDGNLVVYNSSTPLWNSGTFGNRSAELILSTQTPQLKIMNGVLSLLWSN